MARPRLTQIEKDILHVEMLKHIPEENDLKKCQCGEVLTEISADTSLHLKWGKHLQVAAFYAGIRVGVGSRKRKS